MFRRSLIIATLALAAFALFATFGTSDDAEAQGPGFETGAPTFERVVHVFYPRARAERPSWAGGPNSGGESCAASTTNVHWDNPEVTYEINYSGVVGSDSSFRTGVIEAFQAWNAVGTAWQATAAVQAGVAHASSLDNQMDGRNSVTWEPLPQSYAGAIAVTFTWRSLATGIIAEVDTVNNSALAWTQNASGLNPELDLGDPTAFDVQNIMAHEVGHWLLLDHVNLSDHTMYTYGSLGEIQKRSLACGDIEGIQQMYGGGGTSADVPGYCKRHPERDGCPQ